MLYLQVCIPYIYCTLDRYITRLLNLVQCCFLLLFFCLLHFHHKHLHRHLLLAETLASALPSVACIALQPT